MLGARLTEFLRYKISQTFHGVGNVLKGYPVQALLVAGLAVFGTPAMAAGAAAGFAVTEAGLKTATGQSLFTKQGWQQLAGQVKQQLRNPLALLTPTSNKIVLGSAIGAATIFGGIAALPILGAAYLGVREFGNRFGKGRKIISQTGPVSTPDQADQTPVHQPKI